MTETSEMSHSAELSETNLSLERTYDASPEEVFNAWTNPEVLRRWWAVDPNGSTRFARWTYAWAGGIDYRWNIQADANTLSAACIGR